MVEITYADGTTELVERCFAVLGQDEVAWYVAQRRPGSPLRWHRPEELLRVDVEVPPPASPPRKEHA